MIVIRDRDTRGRTRLGWLDSRHTFSFGNYRDPGQMGFRALRVINEDTVIPGGGFASHAHRDMEIVSYVLAGELEHKDSLGNGFIIAPGQVQRRSAGTGIRHSEFNPSHEQALTYQVPMGRHVWIQLVRGVLELEGDELREGDGAAVSDERSIGLEAVTESEVLLFDLA